MEQRKEHKLYTIAVVLEPERVLLGYKKRGFGMGKWNGFGGKVEQGESVEQAAIRELKEECGLEAETIFKNGVLNFEFLNNPVIMEVHIFTITSYKGDVMESEEMTPKWFGLKDVPYGNMWTDDKHWFPLLLDQHKFTGYFLFQDENTILKYSLEKLA